VSVSIISPKSQTYSITTWISYIYLPNTIASINTNIVKMHFNMLALIAPAFVASVAVSVSRDENASLAEQNTAVATSAAANCVQGATFCGWYLRDHCMTTQPPQ
jgi:hypothetical protein